MRRRLQRLATLVPHYTRTQLNHTTIVFRALSTFCRPNLRCHAVQPFSAPMTFSRGYARIVSSPTTKGISQTEYDLRRTLLAQSLPDGSICVLVGASMKYSSDSVLYVPKLSF